MKPLLAEGLTKGGTMEYVYEFDVVERDGLHYVAVSKAWSEYGGGANDYVIDIPFRSRLLAESVARAFEANIALDSA